MKKLSITTIFSLLLFSINLFAQEAELIDEFGITSPDNYRNRMDNIVNELQKSTNSDLYIIYYGGKYRNFIYLNAKTYKPTKSELVDAHRNDGIKWAKSIPLYFSTATKYPKEFHNSILDRITLVNGGYRNEVQLSIWLVSKDVELPKPTPTLEEKEIDFKAKHEIPIVNMAKCYGIC